MAEVHGIAWLLLPEGQRARGPDIGHLVWRSGSDLASNALLQQLLAELTDFLCRGKPADVAEVHGISRLLLPKRLPDLGHGSACNGQAFAICRQHSLTARSAGSESVQGQSKLSVAGATSLSTETAECHLGSWPAQEGVTL